MARHSEQRRNRSMSNTTSELDVRRDDDGVVWVTLDRPDKLNALTWGMLEGLHELFVSLADDRAARVVVLRGRGRGFCAGVDLADTPYAKAVLSDGPREERSVGMGFRSQQFQTRLVLEMRRAPQPIIALVHGPAYGAGLALALASDVLMVGSSARLSAAFIKVGLSGCDMGVSYFLTRALGLSTASEILLTGDPFSAQRAVELGLSSRLVADEELEAAGGELARRMLANSPFGLRLTKECLRFSFDAPGLEAAIAMEDRNQQLASEQDAVEAFRAAREKRKPNFLP
jgi:enoyl-CoA hydratase